MKKNLIACLCFFLIFCLMSVGFYQVFQYRFDDEDGIEGIKQLYKTEEDSVDVLCLGSSHMFVNVNTAVLWEEYGIAAFDLGGTIQPFWNTYFYLKEALKTQKPKLLVLDCYAATLTEEYADESGIIKNTFGMKFSGNKIEAIKASAPDKHLTYLLGYPGYHARYSALGRQDFIKDKGIADFSSWKGNHFVTETAAHVAKLRNNNIKEITETEDIYPKEEEYLQKIIDLAREENIPLFLMATPYFPTEREIRIFNRVEEIANANRISFINYNYYYDEMGLDLSADFADGHHLNIKGSPKFTRFFAKDIKMLYELPDRRGDNDYADYDIMTEVYHQRVYNQSLKEAAEAGDLQAVLDLADNENYIVAYGIGSGFTYHESFESVCTDLSQYGIFPRAEGLSQVYVMDMKEKSLLYHFPDASMCFSEQGFHYDLGDYDVMEIRCPAQSDMEQGNSAISINYNNEIYSFGNDVFTIFVYDRRTKAIVGVFGLQ